MKVKSFEIIFNTSRDDDDLLVGIIFKLYENRNLLITVDNFFTSNSKNHLDIRTDLKSVVNREITNIYLEKCDGFTKITFEVSRGTPQVIHAFHHKHDHLLIDHDYKE
jgi:hypothetical protein